MRTPILCAAVAICILSNTSSAQTGLRSASLPDRTPQNPFAVPPMGLPTASLPDRTPQNPILPVPRDVFLARPDTYVPRPDAIPVFPIGVVADNFYPASTDRLPQVRANGYLQLEAQPGTAQVYVDGLYVGTADDFRRLMPGRSLEDGAHRVELRAPGYETITVDVRVFPNETVTYRAELKRIDSVTDRSAAAVRAVPKTFYVIPGCYAGDKPPSAVRLPRACDAAKVRTIPPVVSTFARAR